MAAHTLIIGLYGIPACGKSTLAKYLAEHPAGGLKVATMKDCKRLAHRHKWQFAMSFTPRGVWAAVRLRRSAPRDKIRRDLPFGELLHKEAFNRFVKKYTDYDVVVLDHSDIQTFVSYEGGENLHESETFRKACLHYLVVSHCSAYVYCRISAKESLQRMNSRGRDLGRIDLIKDQNIKLQELESETGRFDYWTTVLKERQAKLFEIDMNDTVPVIAESFWKALLN